MALSKIGLTELSYWKGADTDGSSSTREGGALRTGKAPVDVLVTWADVAVLVLKTKQKNLEPYKRECIW